MKSSSNGLAAPPVVLTVRAVLSGLLLLGLPCLGLGGEGEAPAAGESTAPAAATAGEGVEAPVEAAREEGISEGDQAGGDEEAGASGESETTEGETAEEAKPVDPEPGEFRNWFNVSVGGLIVDGDRAPVQRRFGLPASAFGGVEDFHFEKDVGKRGLFKIDGRGIFDNEEYRLRLDYTDSEKGYVRGGIIQARDYWDGSGGWFPAGNTWFDLYDDQLESVRGTVFFEAGLRMPSVPELTFRYAHNYRDGQKDSTIWGGATVPGYGVRSIVPAYWDLDESSDTLSFDIRHTLGKTTFGAGFTYEAFEMDNALNHRRQPFETSDRYTTQTERVERDVYSARAYVDTIFHERLRLTSGYLFTTLDNDFGGARIVGAGYDPVYDPAYGRRDVGFLDLSGTSSLDQHVWNVNLLWTPVPNLAVIPAVRIENQSVDGASTWLDTGAVDIAREAANTRDMVDLSEQLEIRYTGLTNIVLYARGDWTQGDGNLLERQATVLGGLEEYRRDTDFDRFSQKYTVGAHWYPLRRVNFHAQYYRKMRDDRYEAGGETKVAGIGLYPAFLEGHDFVTDDVNFRVTWRPTEKVTSVTRYDFQLDTIDMTAEGLGRQRAAESTAHIISETVTWSPTARLYVQPGFTYVLDTTESAAAGDGSPVEPANNDYFNVHCGVGVVVDERTDFNAQYRYYLADNFRDVSAVTQPYGAGSEEHGVMATLMRRISPKLRVTLRYGYFMGREELAGGFNDYDAHLVMTSAQYLF